jgi:hypothetical protein
LFSSGTANSVYRLIGYQQNKPAGAGAGLLPARSLKAINAILGHIDPIIAA